MENITILDIIEDDILFLGKDILSLLLKDQTTKKNIIWATNDYSAIGDGFNDNNEILPSLITGQFKEVIQPRISKTKDNQSLRTKDRAEVFTPSWLCNLQNNDIDNQWFGKPNVFNTPFEKSWITNQEPIKFPNTKGKSWKDYVDSRRIEIACGEGPYLVSRYDPLSGAIININDRIGILDRKLRIVNENTTTLIDWFKWTQRAYESVYGYEYQGDNLLLARENLLYTFIENKKFKFNEVPTLIELKKISVIISWNIWQMDGINSTVPLGDRWKIEQLSLFDSLENSNQHTPCKIKDWRSKKIKNFYSLIRGNESE